MTTIERAPTRSYSSASRLNCALRESSCPDICFTSSSGHCDGCLDDERRSQISSPPSGLSQRVRAATSPHDERTEFDGRGPVRNRSRHHAVGIPAFTGKAAEYLVRTRHVRSRTNFVSPFNLIWAVQSFREKYSSFVLSEHVIVYCHPASCRGAYASSRYAEVGSGGRDGGAGRALSGADVKSRGPGAPMLASSLWEMMIPEGDGG